MDKYNSRDTNYINNTYNTYIYFIRKKKSFKSWPSVRFEPRTPNHGRCADDSNV